ncbi:hypothetical protein DH2020_027049 [Rehmannia glutinosa]|uniref:Uncharacterized protein n=1 Tax=Rehmannia glutinosa TaxID=99300 RepID=A0ABR0VVE0_REHGL
MGTACDLFGPRLASPLSPFSPPPVYFTFSLAAFVSTQILDELVVLEQSRSHGKWRRGRVGQSRWGATRLIMPLVFDLIKHIGANRFTAWRIAFFIPGLFQTLSAFGIFFLGQDLPDGNYSQLHKSGDKHKDNFARVFHHAVGNYRGWILALTYGYCFGVELTIDNIIAQYFYDKFNVNLNTAGIIAASFGLANIFSRPGGGILSDVVGKKFGMRGRLWTLWIVQTLGGVFCILLGKVGSLSVSIAVMLIFSVFVQAACGLTFGVVPFVSSRSLGIVSGMTGAGGNVGAVLTQVIFFRGSKYSTETGITLMGVMIICCTSVIMFIYFPQWGGMFCGPSSKGTTEEDYYMSEWTSAEKEKGFHRATLKFSENSRTERGIKKVESAPTPTPDRTPNTYV